MPTAHLPVSPLTVIAWRLTALRLDQLWLHYVEIGGNQPRTSLGDYLAGRGAWTAPEHNALAHVINEELWSQGRASLAPYRDIGVPVSGVAPQADDPFGEAR